MKLDDHRCLVAVGVMLATGFLSKVNADVKSAYACSDTSSGVGNDCILFNISCKSDKRIQIHSALYGFRVSNPDKCKTDNGKCRKDNGCCFAASGDKKTIFSQLHIYNVYRACSWNSSCISQAPFGHDSGGSSKYSVLKYNCVKEEPVVRFCKPKKVTGNSVNLIFRRDNFFPSNSPSSNPTKCLCTIHSKTGDGFRIAAPDLRLMSESSTCQPTTALHGITERAINCSGSISNIKMSEMSFSDKILKLSFKHLSPPEFIWVKINARKANNAIDVKCFDVDEDIPFTSTSESPILTSGKSGIYSPFPDSMQTTEVQKTTSGHLAINDSISKEDTETKNELPVAAIIVPCLAVIVVIGVVIFIWWRRTHDKISICAVLGKIKNKESVSGNDSQDAMPTYFDVQGTPRTEIFGNNVYLVLDADSSYRSVGPEQASKKNPLDDEEKDTACSNSIKHIEVTSSKGSEYEYSTIDPNDVAEQDSKYDTVQNMPDDEYDVVNRTRNPVIRDPNYDALNSDGLNRDQEFNDEYSHTGTGSAGLTLSTPSF